MTAPYQGLWSKAPLFRTLDAAQLARVGELVEIRPLDSGQTLFVAGEPCSGFFVVLEGAIQLVRPSEDGDETPLSLVRSGQSFAEAALFAGGIFPATARALERTLLAKVPRTSFLALLRSDAELCLRMLESLSVWHHRLTFQNQSLRAKDTRGRLQVWLAEEARRAPNREVLLRVSKKIQAAQLGMSPETFSRQLRRLTEEGLVIVQGARIKVLGDLEA
ncbi:transcriptional regulator [Geothrix limicola]|uniref:Transcriptional regulator n=1 Tax=Geothrix limicola TaxID=2927978 RepID=A0ABQ5QE85_9BACT|nr:Crp/Fnr family transcriptional regulator [Geothrix limicola]GLH72750.1 transcriptional regulator [Geothrix limicola]